MHQNRASPLASDFYRRRGYRREFRSEDHFYQFSSQKKSQFASCFLRRGNRASWGLKKSRDFSGSGNNRCRNRRESRDFGALSSIPGSLTRKPLISGPKKGHYERGLFTGGISRISKISRISREWSDSPFFSRVWRLSRISKFSIFSKISRKWTFLKRPLFQKTPFSEPDVKEQKRRKMGFPRF